MSDRRCKLGLRARIEIARAVEHGATQRAVAAQFAVSPATVNTIWQRWRDAAPGERERGACLEPRRPVPKSCPWALGPEIEQRILDARARTNWGPMRLQALTGRHRSTTWKVLKRHGCSQRRRSPKPERPPKRFEWAQPGALLHIDAFSLVKFDEPGHWATGDRSQAHRSRDVGKTVVIGVQDDHSRAVYAELHSSENAENVSACLRRAVAWFAEQGAGPVEAVLSDNAKCYATSNLFRRALTELGARHILTPPYTPQWNGKLERFWQTLDQEWAHSRQWSNSATRDRALASYLRFYNRRRPHSACGGRPPLTRVQQDREQNN
jgi:transposase InsO family protein